MKQNQNGNLTHSTTEGEPARGNPQAVQIAMRLRAVDASNRAIVSNISAVQPSSGMVFLDFGFVEQHAMDEIGKAVRSGQSSATIDGRLECRIAMGMEHIVQLHRQLEQVLAATRKTATRTATEEPMTVGADTILQ